MNIIRELRKKAGIGQKELADIIGVSIPTVSDWETGKKQPSKERLRKLAEYFHVDELVILGKRVVSISDENNPRTTEARIISGGIDKMPPDQREQALNVMRAMFAQYDYFEKGTEPDDKT